MSNPRLYKSSRSTQVTQLCVCAVNQSCAEGSPSCLLATGALSRADAAGVTELPPCPCLLVLNRAWVFWYITELFFPCLFLNMHSSYLSICCETLRIRSLRNLWQDNSDNFWMLQIFWHLSLQLLSWICNRNYIFPLLYTYYTFLGGCSQPLKLLSPSLSHILMCCWLLCSLSSQSFLPPLVLYGAAKVVASVRSKPLFLMICCLSKSSEMSHKKLISLSVFHLHWNWEYCFVLCNHKCFETCLIEMLYLLFCRDFSNGNHQRQSWLKAGMFSLFVRNYFVQKGSEFLAFRKWKHEQWARSQWQSGEFACFVPVIAWLDFY